MSDQLKYIVTELNKINQNKVFNLISFDALNPEQLLQVLTDVFAEVDSSNNVDVRTEQIEETTLRVLEMLRILKYNPGPQTNANAFRQGLVQGEKEVIYAILEWLFQNMPDLKKRVYLAQYLMKLDIPVEFLGDPDIAALHDQYERLIEDFKVVHKENEKLKNSGMSIAELRSDIDAMEKEKEIVLKRIERMQHKVDNIGNKDAMLSAAHALRLEREREKEIVSQQQDLQTELNHSDQRISRLKRQLKDMRQAALGATPEGLVQRLEEETNVMSYVVNQKLPKDVQEVQKQVDILEMVTNQPAMGRNDLDLLTEKIKNVNKEVNKMVEVHMATTNPADDKLAPFRQQAAIIARKKEKAVEQIAELKSDLATLVQEVDDKNNQLREFAGETVLRGEEFKRYVNKLRGRSAVYKRHRADLLAVQAEAGVLTRTIDILKSRDDAVKKRLSSEEAQRGVAGFRDAKERMGQVSGEKLTIDQEKGKSLEEMSSLVLQLSQRIASKKAQLAPVIKELRPLREKCQDMTIEFEKKKKIYDSTSAGLESNLITLEHDVRALRDEVTSGESNAFLLEAESVIYRAKLDQLQEEIRLYVSSDPSDKSKSLREKLIACINEQEKLSRHSKEEQRLVKESQTNRARQMKLWSDLQRLLQAKMQCMEREKQVEGTVHRVKGSETLVLFSDE